MSNNKINKSKKNVETVENFESIINAKRIISQILSSMKYWKVDYTWPGNMHLKMCEEAAKEIDEFIVINNYGNMQQDM